MANSNKKFGEAFFAELNDDTYLHKIYEDILFNYSIKVFSFKKRAKRQIPKIDALTFADLLSKSKHSCGLPENVGAGNCHNAPLSLSG